MKFPVFLLGLVVVSAGIGITLWILGVSAAMCVTWAIVTCAVGQILYVVMIAMLAAAEKRLPQVSSTASEAPTMGAGRGLAPQAKDQQV